MTNIKFKVRVSGFKDYIALDMIDKSGKVVDTPIYITPKKPVEVHTGKPSSEQPPYPSHYDDFNDKWELSMDKEGTLYLKWLSGFQSATKMKMNPLELTDFKYGRVRQDNGSLKRINP